MCERPVYLMSVVILLSGAGCGKTASPAATTHPLDGEWLVTHLGTRPIPDGAEVTVVYQGACGCTSVDTHGDKSLGAVLNSSSVKELFDQYRGHSSANRIDEVKLSHGDLEVRLKRIGPVRQRHIH